MLSRCCAWRGNKGWWNFFKYSLLLGHFLFAITVLCCLSLVVLNFSRPPTGDRVMGYGLALAFWGLCWVVSSGILVGYVAARGGFTWVSLGVWRGEVVWLGWLCVVVTVFFSGMLRWEHSDPFPRFVFQLAQWYADIWMALLVLAPTFLLLTAERQASVATDWYRVPLFVAFVVSMCVGLGLCWGWFRAQSVQQTAVWNAAVQQYDELQRQHLEQIEQHTEQQPILDIIAFTGRFTQPAVRQAALLKLQSRPNLEAEVIELLQHPYYYYHAYQYLDGNRVAHPEHFEAPLRQSLQYMAKDIRNSIVDSNNLQDWHFDHLGIERLLRALDEQFVAAGIDLRPALRLVLKALDTPKPPRFRHVQFKVRSQLAQWLGE